MGAVASISTESDPTSGIDIQRQEQGPLLITVTGELDIATAPKLHERLMHAFQTNPSSVVIDLSGVTFIDSTGLGVLVNARQRGRSVDVDVLLTLPEGQARFPFEVTGLVSVFDQP